MDAKANAMLIMLNGTQEERAPLEQTQARLTANGGEPRNPHAINLRQTSSDEALGLRGSLFQGRICNAPIWGRALDLARSQGPLGLGLQDVLPDANVTLNVPPESPLFEWQSASSFKPPSKLKFAPASDVTGSPASRIFLPTPQDTPTTSTNLSTNHTESADVSVIGDPPKHRIDEQTEDTDTLSVSVSLSTSVKVLRGAWACSSIEVL
ncbi:hypothetical protein PCASD_15094 [Puccinia coronata f. sp. avenae]|uniref:Uncharacterized protein n=1 Tax=Puccinia coronata f. sp. avenae TaxID=200324 RepID=A0A2N5T6C9_9BASI|nr:hypothetical protein PCASD_15094 [Puccinia coronata f. sp. avenae]